MTDAAATPELDAQPAEAERPPAPKPEGEVEAEPKHPEPALVDTPAQAVAPVVEPAAAPAATPVAENDNSIIGTEEFHLVERHLAEHIRHALPAEITKDMTLTLTARPRLGKTDLLLQMNGPMLEANGALATETLMPMLRAHPAFAPLFERHETPFERQPEGHPTTLEIIFPELELGEYVKLTHALSEHAKTTPVPAVSHVQHEEKLVAANENSVDETKGRGIA